MREVAELPGSAFPGVWVQGWGRDEEVKETTVNFKTQPQYFSVCPSVDQEDLRSCDTRSCSRRSSTFVLDGQPQQSSEGTSPTTTSSLHLLGTTNGENLSAMFSIMVLPQNCLDYGLRRTVSIRDRKHS